MELDFDPEAADELREIKKEHREYITARLRELKEKPLEHQDSDNIQIRGRTVFRYTMKEGKKGGKDYRAVYDIVNQKVKILSIFHRDKGYQKNQIADRMQ